MISSARRRAWRLADAYLLPLAPGRNVGRAISPAAGGLRHRRGSGTMQASSPTKYKARFCRALPDISAANRQCTPPSAPCGASTSPCRGGFANGFRPKGSPVRGCGVERRLRRIQRDGAGAAPCLASILLGWRKAPPAGVNARPTMQGKRVMEPGTAGGVPAPLCVGADDFIGPPSGLAVG